MQVTTVDAPFPRPPLPTPPLDCATSTARVSMSVWAALCVSASNAVTEIDAADRKDSHSFKTFSKVDPFSSSSFVTSSLRSAHVCVCVCVCVCECVYVCVCVCVQLCDCVLYNQHSGSSLH